MNTLSAATNAICARPFKTEEDFWKLRRLAIETYPTSGPGWNWDLRRWDGARFYRAVPGLNPDWQRSIRMWETQAGELAGAANEDGSGFFYLQIDPEYRAIEEEMIAWAEEHLAAELPDGSGRQIESEVHEYDAPRQRILARRGYIKQSYGGVHRKMHLGKRPTPRSCLAEGYRMRAVRSADREDCQRIADLLNAAFGRTFHNAEEYYQFARLAPCYREDFHLAAEAPDGSFAAHVAVIYDEENRRGFFEPVCTHPLHLRKHLAQALMSEGLRLLQEAGALEVTVETGDMIPANALYDSIGFSEVYKTFCWKKVWNTNESIPKGSL